MRMRITIVTACRDARRTLGTALESVYAQTFGEGVELEHLVVDGASSDGSVGLLSEWAKKVADTPRTGFSFRWVSEPDRGLYDAINKGLGRATGDVIGILNADDAFDGDDVIARLAEAFRADEKLQVIYGDVRFVRAGDTLSALRAAPTVRYCTGRYFRPWMFRFATFPAHPSTFVRRSCYETFGGYSLDYRICADFEMMLRLFVVHSVRTRYLPLCTTVMRLGGLSTGGFGSNVQINREDLRALRTHGIWSCLPMIYTKYLFKIWGLRPRMAHSKSKNTRTAPH